MPIIFAGVAAAQIVLDPSPARVMGHPATTPPEQLMVSNVNPNLGANGGMFVPQGAAVDTSGSSPILYVSDYGNNRVLAWKNATSATLTKLQAPDLIIGQPNSFTTFPLTNGGLSNPTALLVDPHGNLYVSDSGNNRILRYPSPFAAGSSATPDIVLGQPDRFTSRSANQGGNRSATTLALSANGSIYSDALAMDSSGNLFVTDSGNSRVLRFPAKSLSSGAVDPAADLAIGQTSLTTAVNPAGNLDRNILYFPSGLAFDAEGHLFVTDGLNRLVVFPATVSTAAAGTNGMAAVRFAGIVNSAPTGSPCLTTALQCTFNNPQGIVMLNDGPAVMDTGNNRLLIFNPFSSSDWIVAQSDTTLSNPPPVAVAVLGQGSSLTTFTSTSVNAGNPQAVVAGSEVPTFDGPTAGEVAGTDLFVVDALNNRVLVYPNATHLTGAASVVLGQSDFPYNSPNSIQGKEFYFGFGNSLDAGIAVDSSSTPPHLYVSDRNNHRVLGFADARLIGPGVKADLVIGEPDLKTAVCNFGGKTNPPGTEVLPQQPTQASLCYPTGLAVDSSGNLFVADSGNGRVLRFPAPFAPANSSHQANLVLGQAGFTGISNPQASQTVMVSPYGLVFDPVQGLFVSDESANRVLLFPITASTPNGEAAAKVIGQTNFTATGNATLSAPHHIAKDTINQIYVADSNHNQVLVFNVPSGTTANQPAYSLSSLAGGGGLNHPQAVWVNTSSIAGYQNDIWVGDTNGLSRFAPPSPLSTNAATLTMSAVEIEGGQSLNCSGTSSSFCSLPVMAIAQDSFGNLYAADGSNRVGIRYPALRATNSANYSCAMGCALGGLTYSTSYLAPGAFGTLFFIPQSVGSFTSSSTINGVLPVPVTLGGVQVQIDGRASPITFAGPGQINFIVPFEAPDTGTAQLAVVNVATSQVLGSGTLTMSPASPAFFTNNAQGTGQIAALNCNTNVNGCDNTLNGAASPSNPGSTIQLFLTGQGVVTNAPPDGAGDCAAINTGSTPLVVIGGSTATVSYSGLAPCYPGLWQINVQIPTNPANLPGFPAGVFPVLVDFNDFLSNTSTNNKDPNVATTIAIKSPS